MKRHLSRKEFLSLGVYGGLGLFAAACTLDDVPATGVGGASGTGSNTVGSGTAGNATSTTATSGTAGSSTIGTGGNGGSTGAATTGSGGSGGAGTGGKGGSSSGGATGAGGSGGGSAGSGGKGGSGGSGGSKDAGAGGGQDGGGMCTGMVVANVSMNHNTVGNGPHALVIPPADITAGVAKLYVTTNADPNMPQGHMHYVQVTAADFTALKAGMTVKKHSCSGTHHEYVLKCGGTTDMGGAPVCGATDMCGGMMTNPCM